MGDGAQCVLCGVLQVPELRIRCLDLPVVRLGMPSDEAAALVLRQAATILALVPRLVLGNPSSEVQGSLVEGNPDSVVHGRAGSTRWGSPSSQMQGAVQARPSSLVKAWPSGSSPLSMRSPQVRVPASTGYRAVSPGSHESLPRGLPRVGVESGQFSRGPSGDGVDSGQSARGSARGCTHAGPCATQQPHAVRGLGATSLIWGAAGEPMKNNMNLTWCVQR